MRITLNVLLLCCSFMALQRCTETGKTYSKAAHNERKLSNSFKNYWFNGEAEITSFALTQMRYGEKRHGRAVLIYVKEDFLPEKQVKADKNQEKNIPVLKLNRTKNFVTGIYPYSIMSSTFYPLFQESHAIKASANVQEWCGQQYIQLNNRKTFEVMLHSYFEGEADTDFSMKKDILEDELWTQLRIDPKRLPTGKKMLIPGLSYNRLKHTELKAYEAQLTRNDSSYTIAYTKLARKLVINFEPDFPYRITGWEESYPSGSGIDAMQTSKAKRLKSIKTAYWKQNATKYEFLRDSLDL